MVKGKKKTIYTGSEVQKLSSKHPLCQPQKRNFRLGNHIRPSIIKSRFVKWPRYVRLQRQKRILFRRLKVPSGIAQFLNVLDSSNTTSLFNALRNYIPESKKQKKERILAKAQEKVENSEKNKSEKPLTLKYGLNHVTHLIEQKKAKLVVIAHDVDPVETVVFLPTLCKAMDIPFCIVKNKSRLGELVNKKTATVVAVTDFKKANSALTDLARICKDQFNNNTSALRFRNPEKGVKQQHRERKIQQLLNFEEAKKNKN